MSRRRQAQGFSLVELMVALTVGLLLLTGVLDILLSNRESFDAQRATSRVQENARLAEFVLSHSIAHAGFRTNLQTPTTTLFPATGGDPPMAAGAVVAGSANTHGASDTLRLRFQASGGVRDCRGDEIGSPGQPEIADFEFYVNANDTLICHVIGGDSQPIADNVDRFEVRYGIDTDNTPGVDRYVSQLTAAEAPNVESVRVQLLLHSDKNDPALGGTATPRTYHFADGSDQTFTTRLAYMLVDETVALENRLP